MEENQCFVVSEKQTFVQSDSLNRIRRFFSPFTLMQITTHLAIFVLAMLMGRIAVTANITYIAMAVGLLFGAFLISKPKAIIAAILVLGLLVTGILPLWLPSLTRLRWAVPLLGFLLWGVVLITHVLQKKSDKKPIPIFMTIAVIFLIYSLLISVIQWQSAIELVSAVKRYFQAWGLMFALAWLSMRQADIRLLQKFMVFVALVQLPFALYELIIFVPFREAFVSSIPGLEPIDIVVGTFEGELFGGGTNAEMATFQIIIYAFLMSRWRENLLTTTRTILLSSIVLAPLFIGETKIVIILLPMMFFGLYGAELLKNPVKGVLAILLGLFLTILVGYVYVAFVIGETLSYVIEDTLRYNIYNVGYGDDLLNRTSVLSFWWEQNASDFAHILMGHGLGSAHSGGSIVSGHIAKNFEGYGINLTAAAQMLWEIGLIGFILFMLIIVFAWLQSNTLIKKTIEPGQRADLAAIRAVLPIFIVYLFYRNTLLEIIGFQIIFALLLGYLAILSQLISKPQFFHTKYGCS